MSLSVTVSLEWLSSHFRWGGGGGLSEWGWRPGDHHSGLLLARKGCQWNGMAALHSRVYIYISMHNINFYGRMNVCDEWVSDCVSMCEYVFVCVCVCDEWVGGCVSIHVHSCAYTCTCNLRSIYIQVLLPIQFFFIDSAFRSSLRMPWMVPLMWYVSDSSKRTQSSSHTLEGSSSYTG